MISLPDYDSRKLCRTALDNGLVVSTAWTPDEGYETAIIDINGVHPVERYPEGQAKAYAGHAKWVEFAKDGVGKTVTKLFFSEIPEGNSQITLETKA